jgi:hypothetical protein
LAIEEVVEQKRDGHDRFAAAYSLSSQYGFIMRPIVDEYSEVLWACLHAPASRDVGEPFGRTLRMTSISCGIFCREPWQAI